MKKTPSLLVLATMFVLFSTSCKDTEEVVPALVIPTVYDATNFVANTTTEAAVRSQLDKLVTEAKKGRKSGVIVKLDSLNILYNAGATSLKSLTSAYYQGRLTSEWIPTLSSSSGNIYKYEAPAATSKGGFSGGYLFDKNGLEMEQMLEKGLFGSAIYNHAVTIMSSPLTAASVDKLVSIFGAHPDFPNTPTATKATNPDKVMANYAARRDKNDGKGFYSQMKNAFIKLQTAVKAGDKYKPAQTEAVLAVRENWEKVNAATIINYCHAVVATMSKTATTDAEKAAALHAYGECVGFAHGWRTVNPAYKKITDAQIDEILVLLNAPYNDTPSSYKFITAPVSELTKLTQIIQKLKAIYGFTDAEIEDFKSNWVSVQGR